MPISVKCDSCQSRLNAPDAAAGKKVKCPKCQGIITIPAAGAAPAPARSSPAPVKKQAGKQDNDDFASELNKLAPKKGKNDFDFDDEQEEEPRKPAKKSSRRQEEDDEEPSGKKSKASKGGGVVDELLAELPEEDVELIQGELQGKERILWAGKPAPKVYVMRALPYLAGAVLFWIVAGGLIFAMFNDKNTPWAVRILVPIALSVLGTGFVFAPFLAKKRAARTVYALTNKRALVWDGGWFWGHTFEEYNAVRLSGMKRQNSWALKGAGDLVFKEEVHITTTEHRGRRGQHLGTSQSVRIVQKGFMGIADVAEVERLIRREIIDKVMKALDEE